MIFNYQTLKLGRPTRPYTVVVVEVYVMLTWSTATDAIAVRGPVVGRWWQLVEGEAPFGINVFPAAVGSENFSDDVRLTLPFALFTLSKN